MLRLVFSAALTLLVSDLAFARERVVLVSVDGLRSADHTCLPRLEALAAGGARAALVPVFPTVTWPNHTTLLTGTAPAKHGVSANRGYDAQSGEAWLLAAGPGLDGLGVRQHLLRAALDAGLVTGAILWPLTQGMAGLACNLPEVYEAHHLPPSMSGDLSLEGLLREEGPTLDRLVTDLAVACFRDAGADLLLVHYVGLDTWSHRSGPDGAPARLACRAVNEELSRLLDAVGTDARIVVVSDHGMTTATRSVDLNRALVAAGLLDPTALSPLDPYQITKLPSPPPLYFLQGQGYAIGFGRPAERYLAVLRDTRCVAAVHHNVAGLPELGVPPPGRFRRPLPASPDVVVLPEPGCELKASTAPWAPGASADPVPIVAGVAGIHGGLPSDPALEAVFVTSRPVPLPARLRAVDVAPTVATWLGVPLWPGIEGHAVGR